MTSLRKKAKKYVHLKKKEGSGIGVITGTNQNHMILKIEVTQGIIEEKGKTILLAHQGRIPYHILYNLIMYCNLFIF